MHDPTPGPEPILSNYQLRLPAYEGPLDVLLRLIERNQLAIEDVSLVAVTDQFLAFVANLDRAQAAAIADFTAVGARLTLLKSRSLLPRPVVADDEPEESDLTQQLREYMRIKDLAQHLGRLHARGANAFGPALNGAIARPTPGRAARLAPHDASSLVASLRRRLTVIPRPPTFVRQRRVVSLSELVALVADRVAHGTESRFSRVVAGYRTRTEVATAFLAVLVLVRRQSVAASQGDLFGDIALSPGAGADGAGLDHDDEFVN